MKNITNKMYTLVERIIAYLSRLVYAIFAIPVPSSRSARADIIQPWKVPKGTQYKYLDTDLTATVTGAWTPILLTSITQGPGTIQRIGNKVRLNRIAITLLIDAANADIFTAVRIVVVQWCPSTTLASISGAAVFEQNNSVLSYSNWELTNNYRILHDELLTFTGTAGAPTIGSYQTQSFYVDLSSASKSLTFVGATDAADHIYFMIMGDSLIAPFPNERGRARVEFEDM